MSLYLGIDPSFTGTGIALMTVDTNEVVYSHKFSSNFSYKSITKAHQASWSIVNQVSEALLSYLESNNETLSAVIVEYPALATRSGAYLAILNGVFSVYLKGLNKPIYWIPPMACDAYVHNSFHAKSFLVNWCLTKGFISRRISHDECTAVIFVQILRDIVSNLYKNSYFIYE